ncbi:MAG: proton-conducting transporter membrane subunit [Eubacteriales bacterium]
MSGTFIVLIPMLLPIILGIIILIMKEPEKRSTLVIMTASGLLATACSVAIVLASGAESLYLFHLTKNIPVYFQIDNIGRIFVTVVSIIWVCAGIFSFTYMKHEANNKRYFGFYLIVYGILVALDFSGNIVTFYIFYELMTILSAPLVFHTQTRESIMAGLKYMFYSFCGAYMVLFGIYFIFTYGTTISFTAGGVLNPDLIVGNEGILLVVVALMILGFSVKAGMCPLHAWLPTAHPVAPAPASAALSGIIVKSGVLGIIRVVYYLFGAAFISGTWVQTTWLILTLMTVFMGSMLAFREKVLKKRLAYSTVSQVSYILFGLALCNPIGMTGAILHVIFHAFIKCTLFLCAGAIIFKTGNIKVSELRGIGKQMPITIGCFTFVSLALVGIPPTSGFISKWYLAIGSLQASVGVISWVGPIVLLVSALLTAGYLFPIAINGFFPGVDYDEATLERKEPNKTMLIPMIILTLLAVVLGMFPTKLIEFIYQLCAGLM